MVCLPFGDAILMPLNPSPATDPRVVIPAGPSLELSCIVKSFHDGESELQVLRGVDLTLEPGESLALLGASGNGKSTLLQIAAGLETPDKGEVRVLGRTLASLREPELARLRRRHLGFVLSGGQQQRVAIARALAHRPQLLFADEPTGNLHDTLSRQVMELLTRLVEESGCSLLLVTHNHAMAAFAQRRLLLEEGHLHPAP
jgi:putative ABC transport system ATP-binding protein